jgi:hypothetical protein
MSLELEKCEVGKCFVEASNSFVYMVGFLLAKQAFYCLRYVSTPFCCGYFGERVS